MVAKMPSRFTKSRKSAYQTRAWSSAFRRRFPLRSKKSIVRSMTWRERSSGYARRWCFGFRRIMRVAGASNIRPCTVAMVTWMVFLDTGIGRSLQSVAHGPSLRSTVDVETDHADLARYLRGHFGHVQAPDATSATADVSVRVRWTEGPRETARPETVFPDWPVDTMIDRHVYVGPNRVVWLRVDDVPALALASEHAGPTRRFDLRFHFSLGSQGWRERLKRAVYRQKVSALRRSRLSTLTYYAVYYPVWWHLESRAAGHPLHAAGVAIDGRALVLAGLPGAGKSTLATSLLAVPGAELLA